jgi:hypothetical protein
MTAKGPCTKVKKTKCNEESMTYQVINEPTTTLRQDLQVEAKEEESQRG